MLHEESEAYVTQTFDNIHTNHIDTKLTSADHD